MKEYDLQYVELIDNYEINFIIIIFHLLLLLHKKAVK